MTKLNITNADIIRKTGWNPTYVSEVKSGRQSAFGRIDTWCKVLKATPEFLLKMGRSHE